MFSVIVQNLCKDYKIYQKASDRLIEAIIRKPRHQICTVLNDVSFSVASGHVLGIIGDNGAGKSTLLKILAGTLSPSRGSVQMSGRVAALLELGAGFHPEFTGRQNIFLNASLLGLSKQEIQDRENEIIAFSELEEFIDRPIKTYSSGMYVRLAFSIATSVSPDILIIDEALSVGDLAFQRKCIDRMNAFRSQGKTMIFCSHSMYHVQELCRQVIWLDHGKIRYKGSAEEAISKYEDYCKNRKANTPNLPENTESSSPKDGMILSLGLETSDGKPADILTLFSDMAMTMEVEILNDEACPHFGFGLLMADDTPVYVSMTHHDGLNCGPYRKGQKVKVRLDIKEIPIREGSYRLIGGIAENSGLLWYEYKSIYPIKAVSGKGLGFVSCRHEWEITSPR